MATPGRAVSTRSDSDRAPLGARVAQLFAGLTLYGVSICLLVRARLGLDPWDVFHQGLALRTGLQIGWIVVAVGALVLIAWIPLRQRPGFGTVANVVVVGVVANLALTLVPTPETPALRVIFLVAGVLANGVATGLYIGAGLGPGARDGLMTGLNQHGLSIRLARTTIEVSVLVAGFALGGSVGIGTVVYAFAIGPLAAFFIPRFSHARHASAPSWEDHQPFRPGIDRNQCQEALR